MNVINGVKRRIEEIEGVNETVIDSSDKIWIHIILEEQADEEEVREKIDSMKGLGINFSSHYKIGEGILESERTVIQVHP